MRLHLLCKSFSLWLTLAPLVLGVLTALVKGPLFHYFFQRQWLQNHRWIFQFKTLFDHLL